MSAAAIDCGFVAVAKSTFVAKLPELIVPLEAVFLNIEIVLEP